MIYHADNIGPGSHRLVLTNLPASNGQSLTIDYAQLWTIARYFAISFVSFTLLTKLCILQFYYHFPITEFGCCFARVSVMNQMVPAADS